jgi:hypothetical protein
LVSELLLGNPWLLRQPQGSGPFNDFEVSFKLKETNSGRSVSAQAFSGYFSKVLEVSRSFDSFLAFIFEIKFQGSKTSFKSHSKTSFNKF